MKRKHNKVSYFDRKKKKLAYWWDFEDPNLIIVESNDNRFPIVAKFEYDLNVGEEPTGLQRAILGLEFEGKVGCAEHAIEQAEKYIDDLNCGRKTPKKIKV